MQAKAGKAVSKIEPTIGGSVYVKPNDIKWEPTQFEGISIKVLYEDKAKGEMTCLLKWEPGASTSARMSVCGTEYRKSWTSM